MEYLLILIIFLLLCVVLFILFRRNSQTKIDPSLLEWMKSMQGQVEATQKTLYDTLHANSNSLLRTLQENTKQLNERLDKAAEAMRDVNKEVGKMTEIGHNMQELQDFLKSPKLRGNIGEQVLNDLISQIFPKNSFNLQYTFRSGEKVDAAIKTDGGILPIDSKFPMENFQKYSKAADNSEKILYKKEFAKDVKKHISNISKKYILPDEGTMDFALMYVPSESVFYEAVNTDDILDFARQNRVYLVSPSTLYAHLQTILLSFEGKKIGQQSKQIFALLRGIQQDYAKVNDSIDVLGKHIGNASNQFTNVTKGFLQMGHKLSNSEQLEESVEEALHD